MSDNVLRVTPLPDGPYRVDVPVELIDSEGRAIEAPDPPIHLCRCGRSANKPFCDGSHARTGWRDRDVSASPRGAGHEDLPQDDPSMRRA